MLNSTSYSLTVRWDPLPAYADKLANVTVTATGKVKGAPLMRSCSVDETDTEHNCTIEDLAANVAYSIQAIACAAKDGAYPSVCSDKSPAKTYSTHVPRKCFMTTPIPPLVSHS